MRLVVLGSSGQIGWELVRALQPLGQVKRTPRDSVDLAHTSDIVDWMRFTKPDVVVNAAAMTAVDRIEHQPELARRTNGLGVGALAQACKELGALLVHFSTDYVFDGTSLAPYREDDAPNPLSAYGASKLLGDQLIAESGCRHLILRVGGVYSWRRANFMLSIIAHARAKGELRVVSDHIAAPTPAWLLADVAAQMIAKQRDDSNLSAFSGVVNVTTTDTTSWHGFANAIIDSLIADPPTSERFRIERPPTITPITAAEFNGAAKRPANAHLDLSRLRNDWKIFPPSWNTALHVTLRGI